MECGEEERMRGRCGTRGSSVGGAAAAAAAHNSAGQGVGVAGGDKAPAPFSRFDEGGVLLV
ncbi:hypothetical protein CCM_04199 [Cordyceps militaris CM01]|uniref:Uncharacterized protein n=1 Tax=Cordyceps militaris (strain CM01) TaxID=983644 RepID=G3JE02_CORMM|nr:uncharacterized protein CCM_04199 [Cordyceps militaris CM01]EGX92827.1 hypothetical protein CCM_04199 [Cordyceps militaris CM01]